MRIFSLGRLSVVLFAFLLAFVFPEQSATIPTTTRVHIFIRGFIPNEHPGNPGYIRAIPGSPGKFVIPGPQASDILPVNPSSGNPCFMTDNRSFSSDITTSSRLTTEIVLVITGTSVTVERAAGRDFSRTGATHKVNCQTGIDIVPPKSASTSNMHVGTPAFADGIAEIIVDGRANNPLVLQMLPEHIRSPNIQYGGSFSFDTSKGTLRFQGSVAVFPAYEAYAQIQEGPLTVVFQSAPAKGSTAYNLLDMGTGVLKLQPIDVTVTLHNDFTSFRTVSKLNNKVIEKQGTTWIVRDVDTGKIEQTLFETTRSEEFLFFTLRDPRDLMNEQRISLTGGAWQFKSGGQWSTLYSKTIVN